VARISVIVPAPTLSPEPAVLGDLTKLDSPEMEILVAVGSNPSHQRNRAAAAATGDILVFLDSDCRVDQAYVDRVLIHMAAGRRVVGGPILLEQPASAREMLFQSLLGHPFLTGVSSARYRPAGELRECDDSQLILCNMAVGRDIFVTSGGFEERLYPNEENEWMTRLRAGGISCWHDPELIVHRPQRKTWKAFFRMLTGYGKGRTKQFRVSKKWDTVRQLPALALVGGILFFLLRPRLALKLAIAGWLGYAAAARSVKAGQSRLTQEAALAAPVVPLFYGLGQVLGFFQSMEPASAKEAVIYRWDQAGKSLARFSSSSD
jgi:hypothetical protein